MRGLGEESAALLTLSDVAPAVAAPKYSVRLYNNITTQYQHSTLSLFSQHLQRD